IPKDEQFYMTTVTFLVENTLFRIPRDPLETHSTVLRDMFLLPIGDRSEAEGMSDESPIRLEGIKKIDFQQLMKVLFPGSFGQTQRLPVGLEEWSSVLKLATLWEFEGIRRAAIGALPKCPITPVDKLVLAREYNIKEWLLPAINELVQRPNPIGVEDVARLGLDFALKILAVREQ
ncbi:hypothetical protein HYDPIDRAFT_65515, partial [Hydnomerulius pinastri MD-312]